MWNVTLLAAAFMIAGAGEGPGQPQALTPAPGPARHGLKAPAPPPDGPQTHAEDMEGVIRTFCEWGHRMGKAAVLGAAPWN